MNWPVARSKTWALLSLGLKLKSKPSSVLVGSNAARRRRRRSLLWARRSTSSCSSMVRNSTKEDCCSTALTIADVERLEDAGQPEGAEHRGELMGQFHASDLLSSDSGSGKQVVQ